MSPRLLALDVASLFSPCLAIDFAPTDFFKRIPVLSTRKAPQERQAQHWLTMLGLTWRTHSPQKSSAFYLDEALIDGWRVEVWFAAMQSGDAACYTRLDYQTFSLPSLFRSTMCEAYKHGSESISKVVNGSQNN